MSRPQPLPANAAVNDEAADVPGTPVALVDWQARALLVLAVLATVVTLRWARDFIVPVVTAFFFAYTLQPIVDRLYAWHVPRSLGALLVLALLLGSLAFAVASLRDDAMQSLESLPSATRKFSDALAGLHSKSNGTMHAMERIAQEMNRLARQAEKLSGGPPAADGNPVVVSTPTTFGSLVWSGSLTALAALSRLALSLLLVFFLLQAGDAFRRKLVRVVGPSLSAKRATVEVLNDINTQVQKYMFMLLVTNGVLGLTSWAAYDALGLDHAPVWAIVAAVLHLVPYVGPLLGAGMTGIAAFTQFESFAMAALAAGITIALATFVGMFLVPWMSGRQTRMNPTAIFIALLFFGWLWGAWGLLLAIPVIATLRVIAERIDSLQPVAELLSE
ncbi:MAG: AI-2E family transporter [Gammaproteobacteria bacterium]|nr:AI-2E family transporter [Gammaproteobacteria bacterium]